MDGTPKLNRAEFARVTRAEIEVLLKQVADAVDDARPGRIIADSEEPARDAFAKFRAAAYALALQKRLDAAEALHGADDQRSGQPEAGALADADR